MRVSTVAKERFWHTVCSSIISFPSFGQSRSVANRSHLEIQITYFSARQWPPEWEPRAACQFCPRYLMEIPLLGNLRWFQLCAHSLSATVQDLPCKTAVASWLFCNNKCGSWLSNLNSPAKRTSAKTGNKRHHLYLQPLWCFLARRSTV